MVRMLIYGSEFYRMGVNNVRTLRLIVIIILLTFLLHGCYAFKWKPANLTDKQLQELIEHDKPDEIKISFWDLPLWIKLHYILTVILGALGIWKFLPIVITKIKSALDNSRRRKILRLIIKNPGVSLRELEELTNMNRSTLRFHLDALESEGLIYSVRLGKYRLFFPSDSEMRLERVLKSERKGQILKLLSQNGGLTIGDIAKNLGISYHAAYRHVKDLEQIGVVTLNGRLVRLNCQID